jgi:uncharacterized protein
MMLLPDYLIDPWQLASQGTTLQGRLALTKMTRLQAALSAHAEWATLDWHFSMINGQPVIRGSVEAEVTVQCQRCLQDMVIQAVGETWLCAVHEHFNEEKIPEGFEPFIVENQHIALSKLVEDELILLLPFAPMHEICPENPYHIETVEEIVEEKVDKPNPFAVLAQLKK